MKILIVDDEPLARSELSYLLKNNSLVSVIDQAESIDQAAAKLLKNHFDVIFIDISLNDENGFQLADEIKKIKNPPLVIFATAFDSYAAKAFDINAIDYVLKPFEQKRIDQSLNKAKDILLNKKNQSKNVSAAKTANNIISITNDDKTIVLKEDDIIYASVDNGELSIISRYRKYKSKQTLSWLISRLDSGKFLQIHRNIVINIEDIVEIEPWFNHTYRIYLSNGQEVPISRSFIKSVKQVLKI